MFHRLLHRRRVAVPTEKGQLVAIALPRRAHGLVWRIARRVNPNVPRQVSEAGVGRSVVVFQATGRGRATLCLRSPAARRRAPSRR
jgi:hypothetical protein